MASFLFDDTQTEILNDLLDRYENAADKSRMISIRVTQNRFPTYFDESNPFQVKEWENTVLGLKINQFIEVEYGRGKDSHQILRIKLNVSRISEIEAALKRTNLDFWRVSIQNIYFEKLKKSENKFTPTSQGWKNFLMKQLELLKKVTIEASKREEYQSDLKLFLGGIELILFPELRAHQSSQVLTWRQFSTLEFSDSKRLLSLKNKIIRTLNEISEPKDFLNWNDDSILNRYGIELKQEILSISGPFLAKSTRQKSFELDGRHWKPFLTVPRTTVELHAFEWDLKLISRVLTIENEETFQTYARSPSDPNELVIYLGGFPSKFKIEFLGKISPLIPFFHWGDLDVGGIQIFRTLERELKRKIKPYRMSPDLLTQFAFATQSLEGSERARLIQIINGIETDHPLASLILEILNLGRKLEQEALI